MRSGTRWRAGFRAASSEPMDPDFREQVVGRLRLLRRLTDFVSDRETLGEIRSDLGDCVRCPLSSGRRNLVFGAGNPRARLMFVGEAPGAEEDRIGEPFAGRAGEALNGLLRDGFGIPRDEVYIANVVKCRPEGNRDPLPEEVGECLPFLKRQIAAVRPGVLVVLGRVALRALIPGASGIGAMRGRTLDFEGIPVVPTFHPAFLLRLSGEEAEQKRGQVLSDFAVAKRFLS